jgi:hypothetical protein
MELLVCDSSDLGRVILPEAIQLELAEALAEIGMACWRRGCYHLDGRKLHQDYNTHANDMETRSVRLFTNAEHRHFRKPPFHDFISLQPRLCIRIW